MQNFIAVLKIDSNMNKKSAVYYKYISDAHVSELKEMNNEKDKQNYVLELSADLLSDMNEFYSDFSNKSSHAIGVFSLLKKEYNDIELRNNVYSYLTNKTEQSKSDLLERVIKFSI